MNLIEFTRRYGEGFTKNGAEWMAVLLEEMIQSGLTVESLQAKRDEMTRKMIECGDDWVAKGYYWSIRDRIAAILQGWDIFLTTGENILKK